MNRRHYLVVAQYDLAPRHRSNAEKWGAVRGPLAMEAYLGKNTTLRGARKAAARFRWNYGPCSIVEIRALNGSFRYFGKR